MASKFCDKANTCKNSNWCASDYIPERYNYECFELLTNADRIRAMSDKELAELLRKIGKGKCPATWGSKCSPRCHDCWLDWLQVPVENE